MNILKKIKLFVFKAKSYDSMVDFYTNERIQNDLVNRLEQEAIREEERKKAITAFHELLHITSAYLFEDNLFKAKEINEMFENILRDKPPYDFKIGDKLKIAADFKDGAYFKFEDEVMYVTQDYVLTKDYPNNKFSRYSLSASPKVCGQFRHIIEINGEKPSLIKDLEQK